MDDYLLDRETLGEFIDALIKKKPLAVNNPEELNTLRERSMKELDDRIGTAVFGVLDEEQLRQMNVLLDNKDETPEAFTKFFQDNNVDIEGVVDGALKAYEQEFLGGING